MRSAVDRRVSPLQRSDSEIVASGTVAPANRPRRRRLSARALWFSLPAIVLVGVFFVIPLVINLPLAFSNWTSYSSTITLDGWANFEALLQQGYLFSAIQVTLIYSVIAMVVQNVVSLALAVALQDSSRTNNFFRAVFFVPVLISPLAAGYIWRGILDPEGPLNVVIGLIIPGFNWGWLGETSTALASVAFVDAWKWIGLTTLVYIAGLNGVPRELREAAVIDGATRWQAFWRVVFPMLAPAFTFNIVITLIGAFNAYDVIAATTGGGPGNSTQSINILLKAQYGLGNFGNAAALGLTITAMVVIVAIPLVWWLRRREV